MSLAENIVDFVYAEIGFVDKERIVRQVESLIDAHNLTQDLLVQPVVVEGSSYKYIDDLIAALLMVINTIGSPNCKTAKTARKSVYEEVGKLKQHFLAGVDDFIEKHRIELVPEYEGGFHARLYEDCEKPVASFYSSTVRGAVEGVIAISPKGEQNDF